jgi:hypothetical protein
VRASGPLEFFVYLLPLKSYSSVLFLLEIRHSGGLKIEGFGGFYYFRPLNVYFVSMSPSKETSLAQTISFELLSY